jgi:four helix bundle protein
MGKVEFDEWINSVPTQLRNDPLWNSTYYRLAMFLYDKAWQDCEVLRKDFRGREIVQQLVRSAGGICANLEEAYGRGVGSADYVRILRIALGEARETHGWYLRARHLLPEELLDQRLDILKQITSILSSTIASHRSNLARANS